MNCPWMSPIDHNFYPSTGLGPALWYFGGVAVYALRAPLLIPVVVGTLLSAIVKIHQSGLYICETCGHKFRP